MKIYQIVQNAGGRKDRFFNSLLSFGVEEFDTPNYPMLYCSPPLLLISFVHLLTDPTRPTVHPSDRISLHGVTLTREVESRPRQCKHFDLFNYADCLTTRNTKRLFLVGFHSSAKSETADRA